MNLNRTLCASGCLSGSKEAVPLAEQSISRDGGENFCIHIHCPQVETSVAALHVTDTGLLIIVDLPDTRLGLGYSSYEVQKYPVAYPLEGRRSYSLRLEEHIP